MHHDFLGSAGLQGTKINDIDLERRFVNLFGEFSPLCAGAAANDALGVGTREVLGSEIGLILFKGRNKKYFASEACLRLDYLRPLTEVVSACRVKVASIIS